MSEVRAHLAGLMILGVLTLSPMQVPTFSIEPPPAAVLMVGDPTPRLDPWTRRRAIT